MTRFKCNVFNLAMDFYTASFARSCAFKAMTPAGMELFPFQHAGVHYGLTQIARGHNVLLGDEPGLGKSAQAITLLNHQDLEGGEFHLVICPASLVLNWKREIDAWSLYASHIFLWTSSKMIIPKSARTVIASYDICSSLNGMKQILKCKIRSLVLDEGHYLKTPSALRTKAVFGGKNNIASRAQHVIMLTGSPLPNRLKESYSLIRGLDWKAINYRKLHDFALRYCDAKTDSYGHWDYNGSSNVEELGQIMRERFMVRREKKDVLTQLPEKFVDLVFLSPSVKAKALLKEEAPIRKGFVLGSLKGGVTAESYEGLSTIRRELGEAKVEAVLKYLTVALENYGKIVVFVHHKSVYSLMRAGLDKFGVVGIQGGDSAVERQRAVDKFQTDPTARVFLGSMSACNTGITLHAASYVAIVEPSWVPEDNKQAIDRLHRIGQKSSVVAEFLVYEDSLDCIVLRTNLLKSATIKKALHE